MRTPRFVPVRPTVFLVGALALGSCASGPNPGEPELSHMYAHYAQIGEIQTAVIQGKVEDTRAAARWLSTHKGDEFPAAAQESLERMRAEARIIAAQDQILDIGRSVARMGAACGSCHTVTGGGPEIRVGEPPPPSRNPGPHMARHAWGADRLWEGLIAPSDVAWAAGAGALSTMPANFEGNDQANRLARRVHDLSRSAREARTPQARAEVYGDFLETCSLCHGTLGMRMR